MTGSIRVDASVLDRPSRRLQAARQAPRRAAQCSPQASQIASASYGKLALWLRSFPLLRCAARSTPRRPSPRSGPRACGSAAGCLVPIRGVAGCCATGLDVFGKCHPFVFACARPLAGSAVAQPAAAPARRCIPRPLLPVLSVAAASPAQPGSVVGNST